jgi:hypothetical protein
MAILVPGRLGLTSFLPMILLLHFICGSRTHVADAFSVSPAARPPTRVGDSQEMLSSAILVERKDDQHTNDWKALVPAPWEAARGLDVTIEWTTSSQQPVEASCREAAARWIEYAPGSPLALQDDLAWSMQHFVDFCQTHLRATPHKYKARIVCGRGPSTAKCPRWHVDHIPVRWIQSLVGPSVEWIDDPNDVQWERFWEEDDEDDRVNPSAARCQAPEGQAVLLLGNRWQELALDDEKRSLPCVHKSPSGVRPWDGRVLLTMDGMVDEE